MEDIIKFISSNMPNDAFIPLIENSKKLGQISFIFLISQFLFILLKLKIIIYFYFKFINFIYPTEQIILFRRRLLNESHLIIFSRENNNF